MEARGNNQLDNPAVGGYITNSRDVTERKERQKDLIRAERRLNGLVQNTSEAIYIKNRSGEYQFINDAGSDLFRRQPAAIIDRTDHELFDSQSVDNIRKDDKEVVENGEPLTQETVRFINDTEHVFIDNKLPYRDESGDVIGMMRVSRDITDRVKQERELKQNNDRLDEFTSIVGHDLRSPLTVAEGRLELAQESCESPHLVQAADAINRSQALTEDLLTLAREGEDVSEVEPIELTDVTESSWQTVEGRSATLETHATQTLQADQSRLKQLFENLYQNAVEHSGDGVTVSVGTIDDGFYVADTGPGISEGDREEIFEAGYSTNEEGTGFGLRIVEQVVEGTGGRLL